MSQALTETASGADFSTGITVPSPGDDFVPSCGLVVSSIQELADRTQFLKSFVTRIRIPTVTNFSSGFTADYNTFFWQQTNVATAGVLSFNLGNLPAGRKLVSVVANCRNDFSSAMPATKPKLSLNRYSYSITNLSGIGSATDSTTLVANYKKDHEITVALNHTITDDFEYLLSFTGETGANSATGLLLTRLYMTIA